MHNVLILVLIAMLTAILMFPSNPLDSLPGRDNGVFLYGGQQILLGNAPYVDFWDHKGPLIYIINALGLFLGQGLRWGVWSLEFVFMLLSAYGIYRLNRDHWGFLGGFVSLCFWGYGVYKAGSYHFQDSNFTETYTILFNVFAILLWVKAGELPGRRHFYVFAGLLGALGFLLRPNNVAIMISLVLVEIVRGVWVKRSREAFKRVLLLLAGVVAILFAAGLWLAVLGAFPDFIDAVFVYNFFYTQSGNLSSADVLAWGLNLFGWMHLAGYLVLLIYFIRNHDIHKFQPPVSAFILLLLIGFPVEMLLTAISGRLYPHYFIPWIPYLGLLAAPAVLVVIPILKDRFESHSMVFLPLLSIVLLLVGNSSETTGYLRKAKTLIFHRAEEVQAEGAVVKYVEANTSPGDLVLVWGNDVWINFLAERGSPTRYVYQYPLFMRGYSNPARANEFLADIQRRPPVLIVGIKDVDQNEIPPLSALLDQTGPFPESNLPVEMGAIFDYINQNYCVQTDLKDAVIYRLTANASSEMPCQ